MVILPRPPCPSVFTASRPLPSALPSLLHFFSLSSLSLSCLPDGCITFFPLDSHFRFVSIFPGFFLRHNFSLSSPFTSLLLVKDGFQVRSSPPTLPPPLRARLADLGLCHLWKRGLSVIRRLAQKPPGVWRHTHSK